MNFISKKNFGLYLILGLLLFPYFLFAQTSINLNGSNLLPKADIFISPNSATFLAGSTFDVPIYIDTKGNSVNTVNVKLNFDASRLAIVKPSGGKSILGIWLEPPAYDNKNGTASFMGVIPNGIVTSSGLIATVTFKAVSAGNTRIDFDSYSSANLNDGVGSNVRLNLIGADYHINPKLPEGVSIYSDTHPHQDDWYNNNSPILSWDKPDGLKGYSYTIDTSPSTTPVSEIRDSNPSTSFTNLKDGVWYFHVRANVDGVWGNTSHFQIKIDTNPPAFFAPDVSTLKDANNTKKYSLSFLTTDSLSGVNHYEVGVVDEKDKDSVLPVFIQSESPYVISSINKNTHVTIRAYDNAGNKKDSVVDLYRGVTIVMAIKKYLLYLFMIATFLLLFELILHYVFGHHIFDHLRKMFVIFKIVSSDQKYKLIEEEIEKIDNKTDENTENNL